MKQPWLKFFPGDWRGDLSLGPCSLAARGLWMEMLCIMSDANPRGSLVKDGEQYTTKRLAAVARATVREVEKLLTELEAEGVFSRDTDGTIYSRRMRRDVDKAEQDRLNGGKGGNPNLKREKQGVNPDDNGQDKAQKLEARNQKPDPSLRSGAGVGGSVVDRFLEAYPSDVAADGAERELNRRLAEGYTIDEIVGGAKRYAATVAGKPKDKIANPVNWLRDGRWKDGTRKPSTSAARVVGETYPEGVLTAVDSPQGKAWTEDYKRRTKRESTPWGSASSTTWYFPSEWPSEVEVHEAVS